MDCTPRSGAACRPAVIGDAGTKELSSAPGEFCTDSHPYTSLFSFRNTNEGPSVEKVAPRFLLNVRMKNKVHGLDTSAVQTTKGFKICH